MKKRITSIAFITPSILSEYHDRLITIMNNRQKWSGYHFSVITPFILFLSNRNKKDASYSFFRNLKESGFDGYIFSMNTMLDVYGSDFCNQLLSELQGENVVSLSYQYGESCSVMVDNRSGMVDLLDHFCLDHQYKKIGFLRGSPWQWEAEERFQTYLDYLGNAGLPVNQDWILQGSFQGSKAQHLVLDLIDSGKPLPEAFIAVNDNSALGVMAALDDKGLLGKIAVGGFDDIQSAGKVGLTTVGQPMVAQMEAAVRVLSKKIDGIPCSQPENLKPSLVIRSSCGCPSLTNDIHTARDVFKRDEHLGGFNLAYISEFSTSISELRNLDDLKDAVLKLFRNIRVPSACLYLFEDGMPRFVPPFNASQESFPEGDILFFEFPELEQTDICGNPQNFKRYLSEIGRGGDSALRIISNLQFQDEYYGHIIIQMDGMDSLLLVMVKHEIETALHNLYLQNRLTRTMTDLKASLDENKGLLNLLAHDIKNPLCHIFYSLDILKRRIEDRSMDEFFRIAEESVSVCSDIIDDVLSIQKYKNGDAEIVKSRINIDSFLDELLPENKHSASPKNIRLTIQRHLQQEDFFTNAGMLKSIIRNLLSNAIKFSPEDEEVHLTVSLESGVFGIVVEDNGPGFTEDDLKKIYRPFVPLSAKPVGTQKSTGLGLSLVKTLIDHLGGRIQLESKEGQGARFSVQIPE